MFFFLFFSYLKLNEVLQCFKSIELLGIIIQDIDVVAKVYVANTRAIIEGIEDGNSGDGRDDVGSRKGAPWQLGEPAGNRGP